MHEEHSFVLFSVCQRTLGFLVKPGMNLVMPGMTPYVMPDLIGHLTLKFVLYITDDLAVEEVDDTLGYRSILLGVGYHHDCGSFLVEL